MKQLPFAWHQRHDALPVEIVLAPTTIEAVIALMATALIVVVRSAADVQEADDHHDEP